MRPDALSVTLPDTSARIMRDVLSNQQINWTSFCSRNQLKPLRLDEGSTVLLAREELQMQQSFAESTALQSGTWFDVGVRYRSISYGTYGLAMMTACVLGDALKTAARFQALSFSLANYRFEAVPDGSCVLIGDDSEVPVSIKDFTQHRDLGALRTMISDLMGGELPLTRVTVAAAAPSNWEARKGLFPCPVEFDAPQTRWYFRPGAASMALPLGDPSLAAHYAARCERRLRRLQSISPISDRLSSMIMVAPRRYTCISQAAESLGMSERTLHRRLADEGTRFSTLLDEARFRRSRQLLGDRSRTVEDIAFAVGFAEPSSFSRAFRRWSGMGSTQFRRQLGQHLDS
jgi:AraC-like DNA-binding protein